MLIKIICIGKIKDKNIQAKIDELAKWISPYAKLEISELPDSAKDKEGGAVLKALEKERGCVFILSEEGQEFSSAQFSAKLSGIDSKIIFVIGGPYGISPEVKNEADCLI
ncbi:MAG: 23S rRNA (pseudouridine(1915)-N(3))-methyltransferase RlmH, partial [Victivallaceae bacterium]